MSNAILDCPSCNRKLHVTDDLMGKQVKCPTCGHTFEAAAASSSSQPRPDVAPSPEQAPDASAASEPRSDGGESDGREPCPYCGERIPKGALRCRFCGEVLDESDEDDERPWEDSGRFRGRRDAEPHRGTMILVFGILSIVLVLIGLPLGIAAIVMGRRDLQKMRDRIMDHEGQGVTQAGWICGIIGTILQCFALFGCMVYVGFVVTMIRTMQQNIQQNAPRPGQVPVTRPIRPPKQNPRSQFVPEKGSDRLKKKGDRTFAFRGPVPFLFDDPFSPGPRVTAYSG